MSAATKPLAAGAEERARRLEVHIALLDVARDRCARFDGGGLVRLYADQLAACWAERDRAGYIQALYGVLSQLAIVAMAEAERARAPADDVTVDEAGDMSRRAYRVATIGEAMALVAKELAALATPKPPQRPAPAGSVEPGRAPAQHLTQRAADFLAGKPPRQPKPGVRRG